MNTKITIVTFIIALATSSAFARNNDPVIFNAGQGSSSVVVTTKMTTMGMTMDLPLLEVKNVVKPNSKAEFCADVQRYKPQDVQMQISSCTFNGTSGSIKGSMNSGGMHTKVMYRYAFR